MICYYLPALVGRLDDILQCMIGMVSSELNSNINKRIEQDLDGQVVQLGKLKVASVMGGYTCGRQSVSYHCCDRYEMQLTHDSSCAVVNNIVRHVHGKQVVRERILGLHRQQQSCMLERGDQTSHSQSNKEFRSRTLLVGGGGW